MVSVPGVPITIGIIFTIIIIIIVSSPHYYIILCSFRRVNFLNFLIVY